jgi:hypothetical protein
MERCLGLKEKKKEKERGDYNFTKLKKRSKQ